MINVIPFFKFNLKRQRFEKLYKKYSNAVSHNRTGLLLMKCDSFERQQRQQALTGTVFVKSKALSSLGIMIKALTFSNKYFKSIL